MEIYDIIMLVVLLGATLFGAWKGLAWQVASMGAIVASYFVALEFRDQVSSFISAKPPWNIFIAMLVLYIGTFRDSSMCRTGRPASSKLASKVNEHPIRNATKS